MAARPSRHGTPMIRSFAQFRLPLYVMAAALALSVAAISPLQAQTATPPELEAAQQAVHKATQADADQYAPDLLNAARQGLTQAQAAQAQRDRKLALSLALRAAADADLARVRSNEAVANAELQQRRDEVADLQRRLSTEASR
jgi:hypothetical protein